MWKGEAVWATMLTSLTAYRTGIVEGPSYRRIMMRSKWGGCNISKMIKERAGWMGNPGRKKKKQERKTETHQPR